MIKKLKFTAVFLALVTILMTLTSCAAPTTDEVAGIYKGSYDYNGNSFTVTIVITENNTYTKHVSKNGNTPTAEIGSYEIDGNKILCKKYGEDSVTVYKYSKNTLTNNKHKFKKTN